MTGPISPLLHAATGYWERGILAINLGFLYILGGGVKLEARGGGGGYGFFIPWSCYGREGLGRKVIDLGGGGGGGGGSFPCLPPPP